MLRPEAGRGLEAGRGAEPTAAAVLDSRTLRSTPESGARAGCDGAERKKGSKVHAAVDALGRLLALHATPAAADDRAEAGRLASAVQEAAGEDVEAASVDQGHARRRAEQAAAARTASGPESSAATKPSAASWRCPAAGRPGAPSPGPRASAASCATTSASPGPSQASASSPSPPLVLQRAADLPGVHNSL